VRIAARGFSPGLPDLLIRRVMGVLVLAIDIRYLLLGAG
jgi:hypothetical protein